MFLYDWFASLLGLFGLWRKSGKLVILGLDNAGKTSLLHRLRFDTIKTHPPTHHPHYEGFTIGGMKLNAYDMGGHYQARRMWKEYVAAVDCVVFIIDANDRDRFEEAKAELDSLLSDDMVSTVPILVLANKIDVKTAAGEEEVKHYFNLLPTVTGKYIGDASNTKNEENRPIELFMCSVLKRQGYGNGLEWLASNIK